MFNDWKSLNILLQRIEKKFKDTEKLDTSLIFFISAKKINKIIPLLKKYFNERKIVICREITKFYEEFIREANNDFEEFIKKSSEVDFLSFGETRKNLSSRNPTNQLTGLRKACGSATTPL